MRGEMPMNQNHQHQDFGFWDVDFFDILDGVLSLIGFFGH